MVTLSGGDLGGTSVDGDGWDDNTAKEIEGYIYIRRGDIAVFAGMKG